MACKDAVRAGNVTQWAAWCCDVRSHSQGGKRLSAIRSLTVLQKKLGETVTHSVHGPTRRLSQKEVAQLRLQGCLPHSSDAPAPPAAAEEDEEGSESREVSGHWGGDELEARGGASLQQALASLSESVARLRGGTGGEKATARKKERAPSGMKDKADGISPPRAGEAAEEEGEEVGSGLRSAKLMHNGGRRLLKTGGTEEVQMMFRKRCVVTSGGGESSSFFFPRWRSRRGSGWNVQGRGRVCEKTRHARVRTEHTSTHARTHAACAQQSTVSLRRCPRLRRRKWWRRERRRPSSSRSIS